MPPLGCERVIVHTIPVKDGFPQAGPGRDHGTIAGSRLGIGIQFQPLLRPQPEQSQRHGLQIIE